MSRKRTKQYLTLLMVIGLVSIAAGGSGTFASFNAQVTNSGNHFASGTLLLHDTTNGTTCESEADSGNINTSSTNGCGTLFSVQLDQAHATLTTQIAASASPSSIDISNLAGGDVAQGDTITITNGSYSQSFTAGAAAVQGDNTISISSGTNGGTALPVGSVVLDTSNPTYYADLQLDNAGSIDSSGITFENAGCSSTPNTVNGTLATGFGAGDPMTTISLNEASAISDLPIRDGEQITLWHGTDSQTVTATADANSGTDITVSDTAGAAFPANDTSVSWPVFTGGGALCGQLQTKIYETDSTYDLSGATCAYAADLSTCAFDSGTTLDSIPTASFTPLALASGGGDNNTGGELTAHGTRYFVIAVKGLDLTNADQNEKATFGLTWRLDQA